MGWFNPPIEQQNRHSIILIVEKFEWNFSQERAKEKASYSGKNPVHYMLLVAYYGTLSSAVAAAPGTFSVV